MTSIHNELSCMSRIDTIAAEAGVHLSITDDEEEETRSLESNRSSAPFWSSTPWRTCVPQQAPLRSWLIPIDPRTGRTSWLLNVLAMPSKPVSPMSSKLRGGGGGGRRRRKLRSMDGRGGGTRRRMMRRRKRRRRRRRRRMKRSMEEENGQKRTRRRRRRRRRKMTSMGKEEDDEEDEEV